MRVIPSTHSWVTSTAETRVQLRARFIRMIAQYVLVLVLSATSGSVFAQGAPQDAQNTRTDVKLHKFTPKVAPELATPAPANQTSSEGGISTFTAQQIQMLEMDKSSRTAAQMKIDSNVLYTVRMLQGQSAAPGIPFLNTGIDLDENNSIVVDIKANVTDALLQQLQAAGAIILYSNKDYRAIRAIIPPNQIEKVATSTDVTFISAKVGSMTVGSKPSTRKSLPMMVPQGFHFSPGFGLRAARVRGELANALQKSSAIISTGQGGVTTEGDATHRGADARGTFGVTGSGLKIGVLSSSINNQGSLTRSQSTGDMPPTCGMPLVQPCITVLQDLGGGGSDEGDAMLEIIYDMAPGANLYFATADISEASFASNILALRAAGCDIIVDDVFYFDEPVFEDGIVAQAVSSVVASGALYFSSAGNEGNVDAGTAGYFEGDFNDAGSPAFPAGKIGTIHNFGSAGSTVNGDIITNPGAVYILTWADPQGLSSNDYDLFLVSSTGIIEASATNIQNGSQNPIEGIIPPQTFNPGDRLVVFKTTGSSVRAFSLNTIGGTLTEVTPGQTHGHSAVAATGVYSVSATPAAGSIGPGFPSGPFPNPFNSSNTVEPFTSDGPRRIFFNPDGTAITPGNFLFATNGGVVRNKPDITAADGVSTTLPAGSGLNPFFGTSAAAPHAAAVAALVKSANPALTQSQIQTALENTAIDIMASGYDRDSGFGIVMAYQAVASLGIPGTANPELAVVTASQNPGNGDGVLKAGEGGKLVIQLKNTSGVKAATGISATLTTTTPGVTVTLPGTTTFADMAVGATGGNNLSPLTFTIANNFTPGQSINFTLTLTYTGGPQKPLIFSVPTGLITFNNNLGTKPVGTATVTTATGTQTNRLFRTGSPSGCGFQKSFPGVITAGTRTFDSYTFTASISTCLTVTFNSVSGNTMFVAAYSPSFDPTNIQTNYFGDAGSSGQAISFGISIVAGNSYVIVVSDVSGASVGASYTMQIPDVFGGTVNQVPVAIAHDVTVFAATQGGTATANINNGSFDPDGDMLMVTQTPPGPYPVGTTNVLLTVVDPEGAAAQTAANVTVLNPGPEMTITKSHTGNFVQGQTGAYTITVTNSGNQAVNGEVTVVDTLPTDLTAASISGNGWTCTVSTVTCTRNDSLAAASSYPQITLTANISATAASAVTNSVTVSGGGESNPPNVAHDVTIIVPAIPDLTIIKTHSGNFTPGQMGATYTITVSNIGTGPSNGTVTVTDFLPKFSNTQVFTPTAMTGTGWACILATLTCTRGDALAVSSSYSPILLTVNIRAINVPTSVTNEAMVSGGGDVNTSNNFFDDLTIIDESDLVVQLIPLTAFKQGQAGAVLDIGVLNRGDLPTNAPITLVDTLTGNLPVTAMTGTGWSCNISTLTCTTSNPIAAGQTSDILLTVDVPANAPSFVTDSATVSGGGENDTTNDTTSLDIGIIVAADLTLRKSHNGNFFQGQVGATYTIIAVNVGQGPTIGPVSVTDTLPTGLTATGIADPNGSWACTLATLTCTRPDELPGGSGFSQIIVTVNVASNAPSNVVNMATVSGGQEINSSNDTVSDPTTITQTATPPDMTISSTHLGDFSQGQIGAVYTLSASNIGNTSTSAAVTVMDTLPTGLTATAINGPGWTCTLATLSCTRTDVLAGNSAYPVITLTVNVSVTAPSLVTNTVTISGGGEVNTANDTSSDSTTITQLPDLTITKSHAGNFTQGQTGATYTITVSNVGNATAGGTTMVSDSLPAGLTATGMSGAGWACTLGTLTCTRGDLLAAAASYPAITLIISVANNAPASVINTATVTGGSEINFANDVAHDVTTIIQVADLAITKTHVGNFVQGQTGATYSITANNIGLGPTNGAVMVVDSLPAGLTATAMSGTGWTCIFGTLTCTRSDVLANGASYPAITLTVNVANNAAASVTNSVSVSGGGELNLANDSATDPTTVLTPPSASLSVNTLTFSAQPLNTQSAPMSVTVTNNGGSPLMLSLSPAITGTNFSDFAVAAGTTCSTATPVQAGGNCLLNISSAPGAVGARGPATLTLTDNASPATQTVTLNGTGIDFGESGPTSPVTVPAGTPASFMISVTPAAGGFASTITFSVSGLPAATTPTFTPPSLTPGGAAASTTLSIATTLRSGISAPIRQSPRLSLRIVLLSFAGAAMLLACLILLRGMNRTPRLAPVMMAGVVLLIIVVIAGCAKSSGGPPPPPTGTPAGTYPLTVTATSGSDVHTTPVTLVVQ